MVHAFVADDAVLFSRRLSALSFIAVRSEITAHQPMCSLPGLDNQIDDLLPLSLVNGHFERLLACRGPEKGDCQFVSDVCLWLRMLRRFQGIEQLSCLRGRLET
jgi:hypothetical protein